MDQKPALEDFLGNILALAGSTCRKVACRALACLSMNDDEFAMVRAGVYDPEDRVHRQLADQYLRLLSEVRGGLDTTSLALVGGGSPPSPLP